MTNVNKVKVNSKEDKYVEWLFKDHKSEYSHVKVYGRHVLVTIFYYWTQESSLILDQKTKMDTYIKFYPVGKVLAIGADSDKGIQIGDIVYVPDRLMGQASNPDFEKYTSFLKDSAKDESQTATVRPVIAAIDNYRNMHGFKLNKLADELSEQDLFTFLFPDALIFAGEEKVGSQNVNFSATTASTFKF